MKIRYISYLTIVLAAFLLASCHSIMDDEVCADQPSPSTTPVQIGFTLTAGDVSSRAITEDTEVATERENSIDIEGRDFRILLFDTSAEGKFLTSLKVNRIMKESETTYRVEGELSEAYPAFKLVVLANWGAYADNWTSETTIADVCEATYSYSNSFNINNDLIPMYGVQTYSNVELRANLLTELPTDINLLRAMAKIQVTCIAPDIVLTGATLHHYNTSGLCAPANVYSNTATDWGWSDDEVCHHAVHIPTDVSSADNLPFTSTNEGYIVYVPEFDNTGVTTKSYISVSLKHADGTEVNLDNTNIYFGEYTDEGTLEENTDFDIVRNHWYKYDITNVDDGELIFQYRVMKWNVESSAIGWNVEFLLTAWNGQEFDATKGDAEGYFCIVCNPKYDEADVKHRTLTEGSSGAAFEFALTKPEGAIWKAHLDNPNFKFAESTYTDDDGISRKCSSTGRARTTPYQIKIEAVRPWTEDKDEDGIIEDNEYTQFGEENNGKEVKTKFWISVSLDGEEENDYILTINPDNVITDVNKTYYLNGRRFAGTNTHITIWQLNALQNDKQDEDLGYGYDELIEDYIENGLYHEWWKGIQKNDSN